MFTKLIQILSSLKKKPECRIIRMSEAAKMPQRGSAEAAGYDLCSAEALTIAPGDRALVHTNLKVAPPSGYHIEVRPRSGLALKHGITVLNTPGTIDADYRGEIMIILMNCGKEAFEIGVGDRIAQAVIMKHEVVNWTEVETFDETVRGTSGFGSTGVHS